MHRIDRLIQTKGHLYILTHDNPDPDALASAWALSYLIQRQSGRKTTIAYGGMISRAENRAMVKTLKIPIKPIDSIKPGKSDRYILIDTQPGARNHSLPENARCIMVIDHHPQRRRQSADRFLIDTNAGATATILVEWLCGAECTIPADLATALAYAIRSETQDLGREAGPRDMQAFLSVIARASLKKLSQIVYPKLPESYFTALSRALGCVQVYRNMAAANLGTLPYPEFTAEVADMLLRMRRVSWTLAYGQKNNALFLSMRSSQKNAKAGRKIKKLVKNPAMAGGHDSFAGGRINLEELSADQRMRLIADLPNQFAVTLGQKTPVWRALQGVELL